MKIIKRKRGSVRASTRIAQLARIQWIVMARFAGIASEQSDHDDPNEAHAEARKLRRSGVCPNVWVQRVAA